MISAPGQGTEIRVEVPEKEEPACRRRPRRIAGNAAAAGCNQ